jgi:VanZ family protein
MKHIMRFVLKPMSFIPAVVMMYIIFSFSAQDGAASSNLSYNVSYKLVSIADKRLDLQLTDKQVLRCINRIHHYIRKCAHFTEYCILAITIAIPLYVYGVRGLWLVLFAGGICVGYASLDEFHQLFVSGRGASPKDVLIDSCGSLFGIINVRLFGYICRKTIFEPLSSHNISSRK